MKSYIQYYLLSFTVIVFASSCTKDDPSAQNIFPIPAEYQLQKVDVSASSYTLDNMGNPAEMPLDSFFNRFGFEDFLYDDIINILEDSLRLATSISIKSETALDLNGIVGGGQIDSFSLSYLLNATSDTINVLADSLTSTFQIYHNSDNKTLHIYMCVYQYTDDQSPVYPTSPLSIDYFLGVLSKDQLLDFVIEEFGVRPNNHVMVMFADYVYELKE